MQLSLKPVSPESVLLTSQGEVKSYETLNFKTGLPVRDGLLCQKVFGPIRDYVCECGKYDGKKYQGHTCEKCGVTVASSRARTVRMGHIDLQVPILNPLMIESIESIIGLPSRKMEDFMKNKICLKFSASGTGNLVRKDGTRGIAYFVDPKESDPRSPTLQHTKSSLVLYELLTDLDIEETLKVNGSKILKTYVQKNFPLSNLFIRYLPVSPAGYRPVTRMRNYYSQHPKNDLYQKIIRRTLRVKELVNINADSMILQEEAGILYKSVDQLFTGGARDGDGNPLPGTIEKMMGKRGILRGNLLGKRTDYSGRSVITSAGDRVEVDQIGLPRKMAYILFRPFILRYLMTEYLDHYTEALKHYEKKTVIALKSLEMVAKDYPIIMNRAPTLHRYGVMSFRTKLVNGKAILVHPIVCSPFNADFDGDTVAIHLPLSAKSVQECKDYLMPQNNLLSSLDGDPIINMSHEMVIGLAIMSRIKDHDKGFGTFRRMDELEYLHTVTNPQTSRPTLEIYDRIKWKDERGVTETCYGRLLLEQTFKTKNLPKDFSKKTIRRMISDAYDKLGPDELIKVLDVATQLSFKYATNSGFSVSIDDCKVPSTKPAKIAKAREQEAENYRQFDNNEINLAERRENNIRLWNDVFEDLHHDWMKEAGEDNPVVLMYTTGARVSKSQVNQIGVAKGLVSNALNQIIEKPMVNSFREGLSTFEYFASCSGSRKSMADKKNLTPKSGYLTRRMITASRDFFINSDDCGTDKGIMRTMKSSYGRYRCDNGEMIGTNNSEELVKVRSPIHCESHGGICVKCYGIDPAKRKIVTKGSNVGAIAAHSLTESTTQMTMRTFHTSGAVVLKDSPMVITAQKDGKISWDTLHPVYSKIHVVADMEDWDTPLNDRLTYTVHNKMSRILVKDGQSVKKGDPLAIYVDEDLESDDVSGSLPKIESLYEGRVPPKAYKSVISKVAGKIGINIGDEGLKIFVDGEYQGTAHPKTPVFVAQGQYVEAGQTLSFGSPDVVGLFKETKDLDLAYKVFEKTLMDIYNKEGLQPVPAHSEMIFRAMSNLVYTESGPYGLRSHGDKGSIMLKGITQIGANHPSWLKSIGFGWVAQTIRTSAVNLATTYDLPTERLMSGELIYEDK
ncbi:DNA-directed RNA polymerase beta' subunit protein [Rhizobium phage RHph_TM3_3_6]|nr:DNA-directed RNA polymerase beta' subunit protein [Rhizobium phage RHph_TM3_3_6]